jgi:hypothetical protein
MYERRIRLTHGAAMFEIGAASVVGRSKALVSYVAGSSRPHVQSARGHRRLAGGGVLASPLHRLRLAAAGAIGVGIACALVLALAHPNPPEAHAALRDTDPANACRLQPGQTHDMTLDVPGQGTRTPLVHLPSHTTSRPLPLVIVLHGAYGSGAFMERYSGFSQRADAAGFAVVHPSAGRHFWTLARWWRAATARFATGGWRPQPRQADSRYSVASGTPGT